MGATSSSMRQLFTQTSLYPHIVTGDPQNGTAFVDIVEVSQVWEWLRGPLLSSVFMDDFYSGRPFNTAPTMRAIFNNNIIVSAVTLRQKRVRPNRCRRQGDCSMCCGSVYLTCCCQLHHPRLLSLRRTRARLRQVIACLFRSTVHL